MKGWSNNCEAVGRADGSRCKHRVMKLFASLERLLGISGISLLLPILKIAATPSYWLHGGFDVAISRIVHPKLHISTARLYPFVLITTSGAIQ
uniref:Uncharacterized protein n=1 Tax=Rhizophora mucronata TaxID=61149 RepID=A0A2P2LSC9_RHIMU